jgi:hypothetical protein
MPEADRTASRLVGAWALVSWRILGDDGTIAYPLGEDARGSLLYTADGRMAVLITAADRPPLASIDPLAGEESERARAYSTCLAYCGRYEFRGDTVAHRVETSLFPNWAGDEQIRLVESDDERLVLRTPPIDAGGRLIVHELRWAREDG